MWNKTPETLTRAPTETLDAGVDLAKVWTAVCDGVEVSIAIRQCAARPGTDITRCK